MNTLTSANTFNLNLESYKKLDSVLKNDKDFIHSTITLTGIKRVGQFFSDTWRHNLGDAIYRSEELFNPFPAKYARKISRDLEILDKNLLAFHDYVQERVKLIATLKGKQPLSPDDVETIKKAEKELETAKKTWDTFRDKLYVISDRLIETIVGKKKVFKHVQSETEKINISFAGFSPSRDPLKKLAEATIKERIQKIGKKGIGAFLRDLKGQERADRKALKRDLQKHLEKLAAQGQDCLDKMVAYHTDYVLALRYHRGDRINLPGPTLPFPRKEYKDFTQQADRIHFLLKDTALESSSAFKRILKLQEKLYKERGVTGYSANQYENHERHYVRKVK